MRRLVRARLRRSRRYKSAETPRSKPAPASAAFLCSLQQTRLSINGHHYFIQANERAAYPFTSIHAPLAIIILRAKEASISAKTLAHQ